MFAAGEARRRSATEAQQVYIQTEDGEESPDPVEQDKMRDVAELGSSVGRRVGKTRRTDGVTKGVKA
jgi:hypothetical protein